MRQPQIIFIVLLLMMVQFARAQDSTRKVDDVLNFPEKLFKGLESKANHAKRQLDKQTEKYLARFERQEKKLRKELMRKDSAKAALLFSDVEQRYRQLRNKLSEQRTQAAGLDGVYNGGLDSIATALRFFEQYQGTQLTSGKLKELQAAFQGYEALQDKLDKGEYIRKAVAERQQFLKQQLANTSVARQFKKFQKEAYYYRAQLSEYKTAFSDPSKLKAKLLTLANKVPAFRQFFSKHSQLAAMFRVPHDQGTLASLAGLQTRANVQGLLQQRIASGGAGAQQMMQQSIAGAQSQLNQLKEKFNHLGNNGEAIDLPDFRPNSQKTKAFLQRIELGTNIQTQNARNYFPVTSDIGLSAGYKMNDKSVIGLGLSYKAGLGSGWNRMALSHQGIGIRSFADYKIKGAFYVTAGYEQNYLSQFNRLNELKNFSAWQGSGLVGIAKKYKVTRKIKGEARLLWDFLSYQQVPRTQAILFRLGYTIK